MHRLLGGLAKFSTPLLVTAWMAGCQQAPQGANGSSADEAAVSLNAEEQGQVDEILSLCGWECKAFADGDFNISGNKKLDAFFGACGSLQAQAISLEAEVKLELVSIAATLGVEGAAEMSIDELTAAIDAEVSGGFGGMIEGSFSIVANPPKCEVSASASLEAAAKCDAKVDPGKATVECSGSCEAEASAMASCSGDAELKCEGTPPGFKCEGSCTGSCELKADAKCEGECKGDCEVAAEADCDGEFTASSDEGANGGGSCKLNAGASCSGTCKGSCELNAGGNCDGECKGSCEYTPPEGGCSGGATAKCEAKANAKVECKGKCSGEVTPPKVEADCEATAKADAQFNAECHPPSVDIKYKLSAEGHAALDGKVDAKAAFEAKIQLIGKAFANIAAKGAKIEGIIKAGGGLITASGEAVLSAATDLSTSGDIRAAVGGYCSLQSLDAVGAALAASVDSLEATATATASVAATFAGS
jgi:hypothetical protein